MAVTSLAAAVVSNTSTPAVYFPNYIRRQAPTRAYQIIIAATITVAIQGSLDGTNWFNLVSGKTASEIATVTVCPYMRVTTSGVAGGSATVLLDAETA